MGEKFVKSHKILKQGLVIVAIVVILISSINLKIVLSSDAILPTGPVDYYGKYIDVFKLYGQKKISETGRNFVNENGIYHAAGVLVDNNSQIGNLFVYVVDTGNNRILGFDYSCTHGINPCPIDGTKPADMVLGQPDMFSASCNADNNLGFTKSPSPSTLCLLGYPFSNNTAETWMRVNIDVDNSGNLYVPDFWNNRVLKYNQPFSGDKTGGKGDSIADYVWGQSDLFSNGRNRGPYYDGVNPPDDHSLWINFGPPDHVSARGVSVDQVGNVWVADTFNNRVLRFSQNSQTANLVLGQSDFASSGCFSQGSLNRMCTPTLAKVHPVTGDLYVLDEYPAPFLTRMLVFHPPFSNGMSAYKTITPNQDGPFTNWGAWDGTGAYKFQSTGFIFNTDKIHYPSGEIWLNENSSNRALLIDFNGNIVEVIGAQNKYRRGGDIAYIGCDSSIYDGNHIWWPGGSIGLDNSNNIYLADEVFHTVYRYALPYNTYTNTTGVECLPDANGVLFPKGPNHRSDDRLGEAVGMAVSENQLLILDEGNRMKVYNDYQNKPFGAPADYVLQGGLQGRNWLSAAIDDANRLWLSGEWGQLKIYKLPVTTNATPPLADFVKLYWADTGEEVLREGGSGYVEIGATAFDPVGRAMYIADSTGTRIFRVKNYTEFANRLYVDMVIGQQNKTELRCNQGLSSPNASTFCTVSQIKFDKLGNLFVVDNAYECHGNRRIVGFSSADLNTTSGIFSNLQAFIVFNEPDFVQTNNCAYWVVDQPGSPVSIAFNSKNQMVVGNDGYYGNASERQLKQLWFYTSPLTKQTPDASIAVYMGTPGDLTFDANDNLLIQDHTWYKVMLINLGCDPEWLSLLPGGIWPTLPACPFDKLNRYYLPITFKGYSSGW